MVRVTRRPDSQADPSEAPDDSDPLLAPELLFEGALSRPRMHCIAGGAAGVFSIKSPHKESPNEDAAALLPVDEHAAVFAVADGLGGNAAGEQAARIAIETLAAGIESVAGDGLPLRSAILDALEEANRRVQALGTGAATTMVIAEFSGIHVRPYHVGDSMILVVGGRGKVKLQNIPHSPVGYGLESGLLNEAEAMHHDQRHLVSNVVGSPDMRIEIGPPLELAPRDTLLLASDGLSDNLHVDEIVERVRRGSLEQVSERLINDALARMQSPAEGRPSKADDLTLVSFRLS